jgi:asparagine synthase (glutamine-hydrolysing)
MSAICGLLGSWATPRKGERNVALMLDVLRPRGPDHAALARGAPAVVVGMRQLKVRAGEPDAIPFADRQEDQLLVVDGRVFNRREVTSFLVSRGRAVGDGGDAELLLRLYQEDGPAGWRRVDGQFALALWDGRRRRLVLARDPLGVRPLAFTAGPSGTAFASEIKALLAVPEVPVAMDTLAAAHYLTFLSVPGPRTLFEGIKKVAAGSVVICLENGELWSEELWSLLDEPIPEREDDDFYIERTRALHARAVAERMEDGPIGALLSGGNDSSANVALMARQMSDPTRLHTFTVGLAEMEGSPQYNDLHYARQVAALVGSRHHERLLTVDQFLRGIVTTVDALDDLVSEPSSVFLLHALGAARDEGVRVVMTGEANDELCCGHAEMIHIREGYYRRWRPWNRLPGLIKTVAARLAPVLSPGRSDLLGRAAAGEEYFWNYEIGWPQSQLREVLGEQAARLAADDPPGAVVARESARLRASGHADRDYLNHVIYRMMQDYYFQNLMLGKLDLLASRLSLEARCPYTAPAYAHFVFNVPAALKQRRGVVKYFFKQAIEPLLPPEIVYRPKQGFRTPVVELFRGALGAFAEPVLLEEGLTPLGILRRPALEGLLAEHRAGRADRSNRLWTAMMLNLWHRRWIQGGRPAARASAEAPSELPRDAP